MKNYSISAKIGVNNCVPTNCEFRLHDGMLFWHSCPKKFRSAQYDGLIKQNNANLGPATELSVDVIREKVTTYLSSGVFGRIRDINFAEFGEAREVIEKTSKFAKYGLTGTEPTPSPAPTTEPSPAPTTEPSPAPTTEPEPAPTTEPEPAPTTEPAPEPVAEPEPTPEPAPSPIIEPTTIEPQTPAQQPTDIANAFAALTPLFSGVQANVQAAVMSHVQPMLDELKVAAKKQAHKIVVATPQGSVNTVAGVTATDFEAMVQTIAEGDYMYLHGPAGCGKSFTAKQIADALGLEFEATQQLLYKHDAEGFVDANGTRHETAFSRAFIHGRLLLLDEFDSSRPEAAIVVNNALANGIYDFPGLGQVKMHPNFRVIAAGNTSMTGASMLYTARNVMDASTKDRFFFESVDYNEDVELACANYDQTIVDFAHDLRQAAQAAGLDVIVSYRMIKRLANINLQNAWGDVKLVRGAFAKELGPDECMLIYSRMSNKNSRWAIAFEQLTH